MPRRTILDDDEDAALENADDDDLPVPASSSFHCQGRKDHEGRLNRRSRSRSPRRDRSAHDRLSPSSRRRSRSRDRSRRSRSRDRSRRSRSRSRERPRRSRSRSGDECDNRRRGRRSDDGTTGATKSDSRSDEEDDPLDAFMAGVEVQARHDKEESQRNAADPLAKDKKKTGRTDIDEIDDQESYFSWVEEQEKKARENRDADEEEEIDYDEEGNPIRVKKTIDPLPALDHSQVEYKSFSRNFYEPHADIAALLPGQIADLREKLGISVSGPFPPAPVSSFGHFGFDETMVNQIIKAGYSSPTPIQAQAIPAALMGRDVIGIAQTGSGKTAAYVWPAIVHILDQAAATAGQGPIALFCVPTRELAIQVYNNAKKFGKPYGIRVICAYGGGSKWEQTKDLQNGAEIVVCTPGRIIDHVKINATNFTNVSYLVFDEADRMFDLGFEPQVRSIADHVRPDRQCLMFSATFKRKVEKLAREALTDPVKIIQGELGEANYDVEQVVEILRNPSEKFPWLQRHLVQMTVQGKVLIFVAKIQSAVDLYNKLKEHGHQVGLIHGDLFQAERNEVIHSFRHELSVLVATDVASRGLDIPEIRTVVNYDVARDPDTHIHRVGRTGRAGHKGTAYTLLTEQDKEYAGHIVRNLEASGQNVPGTLMSIALKATWFRKSRFKQGKSKRPSIGGRGLGYVEGAASKAITHATDQHESAAGGANAKTAQPAMGPAATLAPAGGRLASMKASFLGSYQNKFHAASSDTSWLSNRLPVTDPTPEWKKKAAELQQVCAERKKSRWD